MLAGKTYAPQVQESRAKGNPNQLADAAASSRSLKQPW